MGRSPRNLINESREEQRSGERRDETEGNETRLATLGGTACGSRLRVPCTSSGVASSGGERTRTVNGGGHDGLPPPSSPLISIQDLHVEFRSSTLMDRPRIGFSIPNTCMMLCNFLRSRFVMRETARARQPLLCNRRHDPSTIVSPHHHHEERGERHPLTRTPVLSGRGRRLFASYTKPYRSASSLEN